MKYFSLFSGIGGFELGLQYAIQNILQSKERESKTENTTSVGQRRVESNRTTRLGCIGFSEVDKYATEIYQKHFNHKNYGDITKIDAEGLPDFELLCGGFPCQSFSIAGKRGGFDDTRGTLFFDIARIAKAKKPRLLFLENVKGLLSHDKGKTFETIITTLDELGYDIQWQVLNSKNFGVPQNRERVFIVGHLRGTGRPQVFPFGESSELSNTSRRERATKSGVTSAITTNYHKGVHSGGETYALSEESEIRRLTPTECERLQGFPDGWTELGLYDIMEICVNISPALAKQLPQSDIVLNTTSGGKDMEIQLYQKEWSKIANIAIAEPLPVRTALSTINLGRDTVMLFNQKEMWNTDELLKPNATYEKVVNQSTKKLWRITLDENLPKEKLSTILTSIREIMTSPTSTFAKIDENIIGVIIRLNSVVPSYSGGKSLSLKMGNINPMSDTQRYKTLGNAVTVNVIQAIAEKLLV